MSFPNDVWPPNIEGLAQYSFGGYASESNAVFNGALFSSPSQNHAGITDGLPISKGRPGIGFEASRSNAIYSGTELQLNALQVLCCIKI